MHGRVASALLFRFKTRLIPASLIGTLQSPSQVSQTQKHDVLEKHLQFRSGQKRVSCLFGPCCLWHRDMVVCENALGGGGAERFVPVLGLSHRCYEVLATDTLTPSPNLRVSCSSGPDTAAGPSPCAEPAALPVPARRPWRCPAARRAVPELPLVPAAAAARGRVCSASRGERSSARRCRLPARSCKPRGKKIRADSPAPSSCLSAWAVRLPFFLFLLLLRGRAPMSFALQCF